MPVPSPPTIAKSGQSTPPTRRFGRARQGTSSSRLRTLSAVTATCAIVNESIAPNAYMRPRKSTLPERMNSDGATPAKTTSAIHGVFSVGCSLRKRAGNCRYDAIEYVILDAPMIPAFVAMKRIVAARIPT